MKLRKLLSHGERVFSYKGNKYFARLYVREQYWPKRGKFTVYCCDHPMPDGSYKFSSEINVKPVIRAK